MSEPTGTFGQPQESPVTEAPAGSGPETVSQPPAENPAWASFLEIIPSGLHDSVKKRLGEWDRGVDERFQKVHSEYEPYKWAKENQIKGEELQQAWGFWRQATDNPRFVYDTLGQHFNFGQPTPEQGQQVNSPVQTPQTEFADDFADEGSPFDITQNPQFQALQQQNQQLMEQFNQFSQQQEQQRLEAEATQWAEGVNAQLTEKYPNVDIQRVWQAAGGAFAANPNVDPEKIVMDIAAQEQAYVDKIRSMTPAGASAPQVMSPSGGSPVGPDMAKLTNQQRDAAAVEMLRAAAANR
jgi:hypothetical protein